MGTLASSFSKTTAPSIATSATTIYTPTASSNAASIIITTPSSVTGTTTTTKTTTTTIYATSTTSTTSSRTSSSISTTTSSISTTTATANIAEMRNAVDEQQKKAAALVASLENLEVSAEVKETIAALASFLTTLSGSFSNLLSRNKRDTNSGCKTIAANIAIVTGIESSLDTAIAQIKNVDLTGLDDSTKSLIQDFLDTLVVTLNSIKSEMATKKGTYQDSYESKSCATTTTDTTASTSVLTTTKSATATEWTTTGSEQTSTTTSRPETDPTSEPGLTSIQDESTTV